MAALADIPDGIKAAQLRRLARRTRNGRVACRLLALAHVIRHHEPRGRRVPGRHVPSDAQRWVIRFNAGMCDRPRSGRPSWLDDGRLASKALVLRGPDPERDGGSRWRAKDLCRIVADRFGVGYDRSGRLKLLDVGRPPVNA